jgi:hypothetical protein
LVPRRCRRRRRFALPYLAKMIALGCTATSLGLGARLKRRK